MTITKTIEKNNNLKQSLLPALKWQIRINFFWFIFCASGDKELVAHLYLEPAVNVVSERKKLSNHKQTLFMAFVTFTSLWIWLTKNGTERSVQVEIWRAELLAAGEATYIWPSDLL